MVQAYFFSDLISYRFCHSARMAWRLSAPSSFASPPRDTISSVGHLDPRRAAEGWDADALLQHVPKVANPPPPPVASGRLDPAQKEDFASHPGLLAGWRLGHPPLLFHKGELVDASAAGVSVAVRQAIRQTQRKVVGMVLNAVDDHLAKADQLRSPGR